VHAIKPSHMETLRRFSSAMDAIADAVYLVDRSSMGIVYVNSAACRLHNLTREALLAQEPWGLLEMSRPALEQIYDSLIASNVEAVPQELLRHREDGTPIWIELRRHAQPEDGQWTVVTLVRDITDRKKTETALYASETKFRSVFEKAYLGMAIAELNGTLIEANDSLAHMLGYERGELVGTNIRRFTHAADLATELVYLKEIQAGQRDDYRMRKRYLTKTGGLLWVDLLVTVIRDQQGRAINAVGLIVDITERLRTEAELRIAAATFQSQEGIQVTDPDGVILRVNEAFTAITGYSTKELIGQTSKVFQSGRHNAAFHADIWDTLHRTGAWQGEVWDKHKDGGVYPKWLTISAVRNDEGAVTNYIGTHYDMTERKSAEARINELAFFDQLTGLPNRTLLLDRLKQATRESGRSGSYGALLFIDLDHFKVLNETMGYEVGDLLLKQVALRLMKCVRDGDTVARLGGDEFVVVLKILGKNEGDAASDTQVVAEKIRAALSQVYRLGEVEHHSSASMGATLFKGTVFPSDDMMKQADLAMYKSKAAGRNRISFFDPAMETGIKTRAALESDLRRSLEERHFLLHYQAQVAGEDRITGAEVLVRWQHPQRGLVSPVDFIPLAEETGLILPLGKWVLETACTQLTQWASQPEMADLTLAVNVSAHQFRQPDFVDQVVAVLASTGANPRRLKLELTESLLVHNVEEVIEKMFSLKARGVSFSLDDFGTGYSSLAYLKRLPLDQLKIDRSFVQDVLINADDAAIARTIVALADNLRLGVIAEGVETEAQRDFLAASGCHAYQGYFFSRPVSLDAFEALVKQARRSAH
jgi:diguanylate cyclase (GGDEF)-like protein/PAS domain S-box-containing protein